MLSRIRLLDASQVPPEVRELLPDGAVTPASRAWAYRPEIAVALIGLRDALHGDELTLLNARLRELVRLRVAFHNQCRTCMSARSATAFDDGFSEELACHLDLPHESDELAPREKAAIRWADIVATDHLRADDDEFDRLREHFSEAEIVELGLFVGMCVGFGRVTATWNLIDELPERFRDTDVPAVPWNASASA